MLELKKITKVYPAGGEDVHALKGIDLQFRKSEFVSILGPSGCGKTTMLNIIGGLDQYTSGDLMVNGISTKDFRDRDWDAYRNHSVGFVFQSYNLIPHQSVLQNVELALTLSGVSRAERRKRTLEALAQVGLSDQIHKRPGEMSGGQCQRVAIARAIVNNPDIVLADEPTGALDTETSVQVMDILKQISKDRLVVMVTHNPDLAEKYSTRIVRMLDGLIIGDSNPLTEDEIAAETAKDQEEITREKGRKKVKKPSMSLFTSFGLSLKNLFTKKGRTVLTSFAGSIGIIGIALIYAVSQGTTNYIETVQEQTLSSYPLTIEATTVDISSLLTSFMGRAESAEEHENDAVYQKAMIVRMMNSLNSLEETKNDLKSFKKFIEEERNKEGSPLSTALSGVQYSYDLNLGVYTKNVDGEIIVSDTSVLMSDILKKYMGIDFSTSSLIPTTTSRTSTNSLWKELIPGDNGQMISKVTKEQYTLLYGDWPTAENQVVLFVDSNNEVTDLTLYAMGLIPERDIERIMEASQTKEILEVNPKHWSYEEICDMDFRVVLNSSCYTYNAETGTFSDLRNDVGGLKYLYDNGMKLQVVGIVQPSKGAVSASENGGIGYTYKLTEKVIQSAYDSDVVKAQLASPTVDVLTGLPFKNANEKVTTAEKAEMFREYVNELTVEEKAAVYVSIISIPPEEMIEQTVQSSLSEMTREQMEEALVQVMAAQMSVDRSQIEAYIASMSDNDLKEGYARIIEAQVRENYRTTVEDSLEGLTEDQLASGLMGAMETYTDTQCAEYYDEFVAFSGSTYENNLIAFGCVDLDSPSAINLYASSFADKDVIEDAISDYNKGVDELKQIHYTDYVGLIMSSVTTIIDAITYVLIGFVSVSLVVSSIMIGVITLISVQERTKEIGILRAIGASKKNVSSMFNAETIIIGFASGLLGVVVTYLLCIPINIILHVLTKITILSAYLPPLVAVILIAISMFLTLISGIIPSRSAAKKDPVVALRTE